jgi:hypothetical protein
MRSLAIGAALLCLTLAACNSCPVAPVSAVTHVETQEVDKPVPVPCLQAMPAKPVFKSDAQILADGDGQVVTDLRVDRIARNSYEETLEGALMSCLSGKTGS